MSTRLLTFKCEKNGRKYVFNPLLITSIGQLDPDKNLIYIKSISEEEEVAITYDFEKAVDRWEGALNG